MRYELRRMRIDTQTMLEHPSLSMLKHPCVDSSLLAEKTERLAKARVSDCVQ